MRLVGDTSSPSGTSDLNWTASETRPNASFAGLDNGSLQAFNFAGSTDLVVDVFGYYS